MRALLSHIPGDVGSLRKKNGAGISRNRAFYFSLLARKETIFVWFGDVPEICDIDKA
jgi:hypothetical protein